MKILGIESSCDETAAAVVEDGTKILSNITATSAGIHARTGGVIPEDAARKQLQAIIPVIELALKDASLKSKNIDAIAVTVGPGLIGSLLVGVETAKTLSRLWNKPLIPINHLIGHIYANWLNSEQRTVNSIQKSPTNHRPPTTVHQTPIFPILALVVSGGHTDLVIMKSHGKIKLLGTTRDDASGEAFDKTARLLGFPYPGGPLLAKSADIFRKRNPNISLSMFPRPMIDEGSYDWSFSGLKTAVLNKIRQIYSKENGMTKIKLSEYKKTSSSPLVKKQAARISVETQEAIVEVLVKKTLRAAKEYNPKSLILSGGVAANKRLREKFSDEIKANRLSISFHVPEPKLCTDNAAYIAAAAYYLNIPLPINKVFANPQLMIAD